MSALSRRHERPMLDEMSLSTRQPDGVGRGGGLDSAFLSHLASADLEELGHIFARAYLRFDQAQNEQSNCRNEVDEVARDEQSSAPCEPNLFASRSTAPSSARRTPRLERAR